MFINCASVDQVSPDTSVGVQITVNGSCNVEVHSGPDKEPLRVSFPLPDKLLPKEIANHFPLGQQFRIESGEIIISAIYRHQGENLPFTEQNIAHTDVFAVMIENSGLSDVFYLTPDAKAFGGWKISKQRETKPIGEPVCDQSLDLTFMP